MKSIRIKNLRSLKDTNDIEFRGLTVLVGENSAGKSTLIRTFPLIKQSIETETTTPFLWYGNYVDFGSFKESLNKDNENQIVFNFKLRTQVNRIFARRYAYRGIYGKNTIDMSISIWLEEREKNDYVSRINLIVEDNEIDINIGKKDKIEKLTINSEDFTSMVKDNIVVTVGRGIIPIIVNNDNVESNISHYRIYREDNKFQQELVSFLASNVNVNTSFPRIMQIISSFIIASKVQFVENIKKIDVGLKSWSKFTKSIKEDEIAFIRNLFLGSLLQVMLEFLSDSIGNFYREAYYIAPVRANAERYYRIQNLSVDSVDFQGRNLPMLLANLSDRKKEEFSKWVQKYFGFGIKLQVTEGHISVNVIKEKVTVNMADCGFGYSQILPIITQLWLLTYKKGSNTFNKDLTLIIEQPELHLHPKLQANLIDAFINCIFVGRQAGINLRIVIETHSETIINRIGYLIYKNKFSKEDVNIYIFNKLNTNETEVVQGRYDDEGYLDNWPSGFFDPKEE